MELEYPFWRIVKSGVPISEVSKWDLEDIDKWGAIAQMDASYQLAYQEFSAKEADKK
jgi:hypothetical protein